MTVPTSAPRVRGLRASSTIQMTERVRRAKAEGRPVIGLSSGDPHLPTHPAVIEAAYQGMRDGKTHYSASNGRVQLRELIARAARDRSGAEYAPDDVLVTPGGKFAFYVAMQALLGDGDEVIVLDPAWVSYLPGIELAGGLPVTVEALESLDPDRLLHALTPRTKAIVVNSPVNPTGRILRRDELQSILNIAAERNLWIVFDEVYSEIVHGPTRYTPFYTLDGAQVRTIVVNSLSKTYGMTGWRLGYLLGPRDVVKAAQKIVQHSIYCVPEFVQVAGETALGLPRSVIDATNATFLRRLKVAAERLDRLPGIECRVPEAAFYLFPHVDGDDRAITERWLELVDVAVLPGSAFGNAGAGHLRMALTCSDAELEEALSRIERLELSDWSR